MREFEDYPAAARKIMLATEKLVAERGLDGISLRAILRSAGQANNSAIYHHFGSKDVLIQTIYDIGQFRIDAKRHERLGEATDLDGQPATLLHILLAPVLEAFDGSERLERFVRFNLHLILADPTGPMFDSSREPALTHALNVKLRACYSALSDEMFRFRYTLAVTTFLEAVVLNERSLRQGTSPFADRDAFCRELLQTAKAILDQPYPAP